MKCLVAIDGSDISTRAVKYAISLSAQLTVKPQIVLVYVDTPLLRGVAFELGLKETENYHLGNAKHALKQAKQSLARAKMLYSEVMLVGDPAEQIVKHAKAAKFDAIVLGSHGRSALKGLLLGSVATKVIAHASVPVTVVR
jgi:nucleotide-binding universal stress UspA family protein